MVWWQHSNCNTTRLCHTGEGLATHLGCDSVLSNNVVWEIMKECYLRVPVVEY